MIRRWVDGGSLAEGQLCLTFDDGPGETASPGPGPRTMELARYLADHEVPATFFMCGKYIRELQDAPARLRELGHVTGNHTDTHPSLTQLARSGGDVASEVVTAAQLLGGVADEPVWFRPPYGHWDDEVGAALDADPRLASHVGPVMWTIDGDDWLSWGRGRSPQQCADDYLSVVEQRRRGVVLMHDCTADDDGIRAANRTFETVQLLVPALRERGYSFVGLADVPSGASSPAETRVRPSGRPR
jgi:chitooligosaccharide deacetylase